MITRVVVFPSSLPKRVCSLVKTDESLDHDLEDDDTDG